MPYSRLQKYISYLLIFTILFLQIFEVPFFSKTEAAAQTNYQLISFLVDETTYGKASSEIKQYAEDIQGYLDNTRVAIFPVPRTINPYQVASINERLYYQGDGVGLSQLVGTIIIGPVPLPVVHKEGKTFLSVYPYTDFDDKAFVYNQKKNYYEYTDKALTNERPEIWHSVIAPNTGDSSNDIAQVEAFLEKTHDFYTKQGVFSTSEQKPYVFYFDGFREQESSRYMPWKLYEERQNNIEDITYNRVNKYLISKVQKIFAALSSAEISADGDVSSLGGDVVAALNRASNPAPQDFSGVPDSLSRKILDQMVKAFHVVINDVYFGDLMKFVFNTGRYGNGQSVRVDTIPFLIDKKDTEAQKSLLVGNNILEKAVDDLVKGSLAKNIKIHTYRYDCKTDLVGPQKRRMRNYLEGNAVDGITMPEQCSVFRGSTSTGSVLVEADRAFNVDNFQPDSGLFSAGKLMEVYGNHSPYSVDFTKIGNYTFKTGVDWKKARQPLQDIAGSVERKAGEATADRGAAHEASYLDCLQDNYADETGWYRVSSCDEDEQSKEIHSWMEHKSPTKTEYETLQKAKATQSMPVDHDRYIDFKTSAEQYGKIIYPNLFRVELKTEQELTYTGALEKIKTMLKQKEAEIQKLGGNVDLLGALSKDPSVLDSVVRHVIWMNLKSATSKYKYVLENYLSTDSRHPIADLGKKTDYEISYLGASGTAQDMYVRLDPEEKGPAPAAIKKILDKVAATKSLSDAAKISQPEQKPAEFKCGGPEGSPIFPPLGDSKQLWIPAVNCWIKSFANIGIFPGNCSAATIGMDEKGAIPETAETEGDSDGNGVPDGAEIIAGGDIDLQSGKMTAQYGDNIKLEAWLMKDKKVIEADSFSKIQFDILSIDAIDGNKKTQVFNLNTNYDTGALAEYASFVPAKIQAEKGYAEYSLSTKYKDADISLIASVLTKDRTGKVVVDTVSPPTKVRIRGDVFSAQLDGASEFEAGSVESLGFTFHKQNSNGGEIDVSAPYTLRIFDEIRDAELTAAPIKIADKKLYLYKDLSVLRKAGQYRFEFRDAEGFDDSQVVTVLPAPVSKINLLPSTSKFVKGSTVNVAVQLLDKFDNLTKGDLYEVNGSISGPGKFAGNSTNTITQGIVDGIGVFPVTSDTAGNNQIKFTIKSPSVESSIASVEAIEEAHVIVNIADKDNIIVGQTAPHDIAIKIVDKAGKPITGFHTVVALSVPQLAGTLSTNMAGIKDGVSQGGILFTPSIVAQDDVKLSVQTEGINDVSGNIFSIHPERPIRISLTPVTTKMEARDGNMVELSAMIYDRFGNIASYKTDDFTSTFSIPKEYQSIIKLAGGSEVTLPMKKGRVVTNVLATSIPGGAYITVKLNGDVSDMVLDTKDRNGKNIVIPASTEDATKIDTFYFLNQEKIANLHYNGLYTTLLGSNYGDITQSDYLGGSILFSPQSRSLAVTALINNPYLKSQAFGFTPAGKYLASSQQQGALFSVRPSIENASGKMVVNLYDSIYKEMIARAWVVPDVAAELVSCDGNADNSVAACTTSGQGAYTILQGSSNAKSEKTATSVRLSAKNLTLLELDKTGISKMYPGVTLELDDDALGNYLGIRVVFGKEQIGYIAMKLKNASVETLPSSSFPAALSGKNGTIMLEQISHRYNAVAQYLGNSSAGAKGVSFFQWTDDTDPGQPDPTLLGGSDLQGIEHFYKENGVGWHDANKMLLEFAAGNGMGDSTRFYQTYSTINLGDPVAHLTPKKNPATKLDRTLGKQIAAGRGEQIESYKKLDFNGDTQDDVIVFYESGKVQLLANYGGNFKDLGYWAYVPDAAKGMKDVGFFAGAGADGKRYSSIIMVSREGKPILLENREGKLVRRDISSEVRANTSGSKIRQLVVFDMDKDGADDIVVLFENGELDIFYGGKRTDSAGQTVVVFTKKMLDGNLALKISSEKRNDGGAVYHAGVPQGKDTAGMSQSQLDFVKESKDLLANNSNEMPESAQNAMFDRIVYYKYAYNNGQNLSDATADVSMTRSVGTDGSGQPNTALANEISDFQNGIQNYQSQDVNFNTIPEDAPPARRAPELTFIRSEYSEARGVEVEKYYTAGTGGVVTTGGSVNVRIVLKNTTSKSISNLIYLDKPDAIVYVDDGTKYSITQGGQTRELPLKNIDSEEYDFGFDGLSLAPGASLTIEYQGKANPVDIGKIYVGLFEKNDQYGDVALNPSRVCGAQFLMWMSTAVRSYNKITKVYEDKTPSPLDPNAAKIKELTDELDEANAKSDTARAAQIIEQIKALSKSMNLDTQEVPEVAVPDSEGLSFTPEAIAAMSETIDNAVKGLGCGFGGGGCITMPMNYAPLAPGSSPVMMGYPLMELVPPEISVARGLPIFSFPAKCSLPIPPVWPPCPLEAGGWFDVPEGKNFSQFRWFVTPTLTGAMGTAICWGPNTGASKAFFPGMNPVFLPGGNCIVIAAPLNKCKDDGSDGNAGATSPADSGNGAGGGNTYINASSCSAPKSTFTIEDKQKLKIYAQGLGLSKYDRNQLMKRISAIGANMRSGGALISIGGDDSGAAGGSIGIDMSAVANGDWGNIMKINMKRIFPFPDYFMQWVTRQMEEFSNKLTDLPTLYVILPDFTSLMGTTDIVSKNYENAREAFSETGALRRAEEQKRNPAAGAGTLWGSGSKESASARLNKVAKENYKKSIGGMQEVFTLIGSLPLIEFENEEIPVNVPWIDAQAVTKMKEDYSRTEKQWTNELKRAKDRWSKLGTASGASSVVTTDAEKTLRSIKQNIKILEDYGKFPEKLFKLLSWKETFLEQILCNVKVIQEVTVGWMGRNGKRFRAWVELYVLIKAILKTWQLMIDIFSGYEAECNACKNERWDLYHFIFKLISMILPQIPVIQFPKWPDIILDLHHIRAGIRIKIPEFYFNPQPIVLPHLPRLSLPDVPSANIGLPQIPLLPKLPNLPNLPELPSLPEVKLPELPPPPTIPKLFGYIKAFLEIIKLIKKVVCLLRINPFIPEWWAGTQIAIITERQGKLPIDFIDIALPQFSYPWVDAIKVTTYVNLEFEADFITEYARAILDPFNSFSTNFSGMGRAVKLPNVNTPGVENVNMQLGSGITPDKQKVTKAAIKFAYDVVGEVQKFTKYLEVESKNLTDVSGLKQILADNAAELAKSTDPKSKEIAATLDAAVHYDGAKEDAIIADLTREQQKKWDMIYSVLNAEKQENTMVKSEIQDVLRGKKSLLQITPLKRFTVGAIQATSAPVDPLADTKKTLSLENQKFLAAVTSDAVTPDPLTEDIKKTGAEIQSTITTGLQNFNEMNSENANLQQKPESVVAADTATATSETSQEGKYEYKGLYVIKGENQYHLFDYIDETEGNEEVIPLDVRHNGSEDVLFRVANSLYIKYAGDVSPRGIGGSYEVKDWQDFLDLSNDDSRIQSAPNYFMEAFDSPNEITLSFRPAHEDKDKKFRLEFFEYIDRFDRRTEVLEKELLPYTKKQVVDLIADAGEETTRSKDFTGITLHDTVARFSGGNGVGTVILPEYSALLPGQSVEVTEGKSIYTDADGARVEYRLDGETAWKPVTMPSNTNIEWTSDGELRVVSGRVLLFRDSLADKKEMNIGELSGFPILPGTEVDLQKNAAAKIVYYRGEGEYVIDNGTHYEYRDLGESANEYQITLSRDNDYYYGKLYPFAGGLIGTVSNLALFAPQIHGDKELPIVNIGKSFRIPVYQQRTQNMLKYTLDSSGIDRIWVEGDELIKAGGTMFDLVFGKYATLFKKTVQLFVQDLPGNVTQKDMTLEVYSPIPNILSDAGRVIKGTLDEVLKDEPVDIFRHRNGRIDLVAKDAMTDEFGRFSHDLGAAQSGAVLKNSSGAVIATMNEKTGKIQTNNGTYKIEVLPATGTSPTTTRIIDADGSVLFSQSLSFPDNLSVDKVPSLSDTLPDGIYVHVTASDKDFIKNGASVPFLPQGGYLTNSEKKPIAGVSRDGNVYLMDSTLKLSYEKSGAYTTYLILDAQGAILAEVLLKMKGEYVIQ